MRLSPEESERSCPLVGCLSAMDAAAFYPSLPCLTAESIQLFPCLITRKHLLVHCELVTLLTHEIDHIVIVGAYERTFFWFFSY